MGGDFFRVLLGYLESLKPLELTVFFLYPVVFGISIFLLKLFLERWKRVNRETRATLYATDALLFAVAGVLLQREISDPILKLLFRDMYLSLTALALAFSIFSISERFKRLRWLTYGGLLSALLVEVVIIFSTDLRLINILIPLRKFLIAASVYPSLLALVELLPSRRLRRVLAVLFTAIAVAVSVAWEFGLIEFDIKAFIGLAVVAVASLAYSLFITQGVVYLERWLKENLSVELEDREQLITTLKRLALILLIWVYWLVGIHTFNFESLVSKLQEIYLIDTDIVRINLYNLLTASFLFWFLYEFINLLKKVVKLSFPPAEREDKGGSLESVIYNLGILFAVAVFLAKLGLTWKVILPLAGALGIGLGFGLQTILNNYVSGFIMMFSKNIKVGDFVEIPGSAGQFINNNLQTTFGRVEDISVLTTRIKTLDGIDILVPNSTFINSQIINYTFRHPYVRVRYPFGVAYSSDPKKVKEILLKLAYDCPWAKNFYKPPQVWFTEMGDSALIFYLLFWIDIREIWRNPYATLSHSLVDWVYTNGWYRLKEAGIEIPFPQNDIWFRNKLKVVFEKEDGTPLGFLEPPQPPKEEDKDDPKANKTD